ncbi:arf-GAP with Rho-GAP domain, ANK repeat and PH domain-containing protein 2 [Eucyclogobius newberryi]|uniref:arf-GAP with Rho-GAP domain, ANK repeat and PH domain-containing protein 2 n=1 Tax=Eucyclogobius newberryi TaxID=166745 RepID=UPI003B599556
MSEPDQALVDWLSALRLPQYSLYFHHGGYRTLDDCSALTDHRLLELGVFPTGHRRRILRSLEALGLVLGEDEDDEHRPRGRKPVPNPRHIFRDKTRGASCLHPQTSDKSECNLKGSLTLPPGAGLGRERNEDAAPLEIPQPAPRDPQNIGLCYAPRPSLSSSSDSFSLSETPSDWESVPPPATDGAEVAQTQSDEDVSCEMVENSIYEAHPGVLSPKGPRPTRSYRLRHRPVPEIPSLVILPDLIQDRSAALTQAPSPEHLTSFDGPSGANGIQKAPIQRSLMPIVPYGETFLSNSPDDAPDRGDKEGEQKGLKDKIKLKKRRNKSPKPKETKDKDAAPVPEPDMDVYSTVEECAQILSHSSTDPYTVSGTSEEPSAPATQADSALSVECDLYSQLTDVLPDISPYACFYGVPTLEVFKAGWLDKLSPQGKRVFQRRWVRFDGESLAYYNNEKEMYSKGMILASAIRQVRGLGENKFEVVTALRTFIFRADKEGERQEWMETLQTATRPPACGSHPRPGSLRPPSTNRLGALELRGYKGRVLVSLAGSKVRLCKTEQDYKSGLAIAEVELTAAHIKDMDRRSFEINTPFKNFCFTTESEREKEDWIEAVQESIAETLSDYEVAAKIWFNEANRSCADCQAPQPEWASVNLGVVICKKCAGQHRSLGPSISKVRSMKLDSSIWSNELVELFLEVGNQKANSFWAANLPADEELFSGASAELRATFVRRKYRERKYCRLQENYDTMEQLNQALCAAVVLPDILHTMSLVFSGADVMCATGEPSHSTPYLLAQRAGQKLQMEFLHQNKLSDFPRLEQWSDYALLSDSSPFMDGFLYIGTGAGKTTTVDRQRRDDMTRRWCTLEAGFLSYYESERSPTALGRVDVTEVVSVAVSSTETMTGAGAVFTVELYLKTERVVIFGAETHETQHDWIQALTKGFVPSQVERMVQKESELIGCLYYKEGHDLYHWRLGWFALEDSTLHFSSGKEEGEEEVLQLKQLQELTVSTHTEGEDKIQVLLMVAGRRTVYIHGYNRMDFTLWHSAIMLAAGNDGKALGNQQLTKNGVPIVLDSCVAFVTQYGLCQEGVYQRPGDPDRVAALLDEFTRDARNVKLREKKHRLEDVTETLKSFLAHAEDALLTKELYPYWVSALDETNEKQRVKKYSAFIESLPKINRSTLEALLQHLYRIHQCSHLNQMPSKKLASVFSSCLFQTQGQTAEEVHVVQDLINNYITLFAVNLEQVQQMEKENSFITRWNDKKDTTFSPAGDLIFEVYLEKKEPENCCLIKLSPSMRASEVAETALNMKNITVNTEDMWTTFEVIENGEMERPLHHSEKVLEQVLEWSSLECPSSAFLIIKKFLAAKRTSEEKDQRMLIRGDCLKFNDGSSKLLSGHKFQDKYVALRSEKLLLYRDIKSTKAEKAVPLKAVKCYLGMKKKLKAPNSWGFTVYTEKQQWHFCCNKREVQVAWVTDIVRTKFGSDICLKSITSNASTIKASTLGPGTTLLSNHPGKQLTDKTICVGESSFAKSGKVGSIQHKTNTIANCLRHVDMFKAPDVQHQRTSVDAGQTLTLPPPSSSSPVTLLAKSGYKNTSKKPSLVGDSKMPANLLNELNSVLSKSGRGAKSGQREQPL